MYSTKRTVPWKISSFWTLWYSCILNINLIQNYLKPFRITWQPSSRVRRRSILFWCDCLVCVEICPITIPPHPLCPSSRTVPIWFDNLFWWKSVVFSLLSSPLSALAIFTWSFPAIVAQTLGHDHSLSRTATSASHCSLAPGDLGLVQQDLLYFSKIGLGEYGDGNWSFGFLCHFKTKKAFFLTIRFLKIFFFLGCFMLFLFVSQANGLEDLYRSWIMCSVLFHFIQIYHTVLFDCSFLQRGTVS